ncbi:MAG: hypothetical protein RIN56_03165 [Sporomusaceae bacterium]|nr:hypothetical protein [Sporomusaceae bacterium]
MGSGVFQTDRAIFGKKLWQHILDFRLFFFIYGNAIWKEEGAVIEGIHVGRGQLLRSLRKLQDDLAYIENNARKIYPLGSLKRAIDRLRLEQRLNVSFTEHGTLFTVINYEHYQGFERFKKDELGTGLGTGLEHTRNKKKNDKQEKVIVSSTREGVIRYTETVFLTPVEYQRLVEEFTEDGAARIIEILHAYKANTPDKCGGAKAYRDDNLVIRKWVIDRYKEYLAKDGRRRGEHGTHQQSFGVISGQDSGGQRPSRVRHSGIGYYGCDRPSTIRHSGTEDFTASTAEAPKYRIRHSGGGDCV